MTGCRVRRYPDVHRINLSPRGLTASAQYGAFRPMCRGNDTPCRRGARNGSRKFFDTCVADHGAWLGARKVVRFSGCVSGVQLREQRSGSQLGETYRQGVQWFPGLRREAVTWL